MPKFFTLKNTISKIKICKKNNNELLGKNKKCNSIYVNGNKFNKVKKC